MGEGNLLKLHCRLIVQNGILCINIPDVIFSIGFLLHVFYFSVLNFFHEIMMLSCITALKPVLSFAFSFPRGFAHCA